MSTEPTGDGHNAEGSGHNAEVVPLRASDIHYEAALDQLPEAGTEPALVGEAEAETEDDWRPAVPHWMRPDSLRYYRARAVHGSAVHTLHSPEYLVKTVVYGICGVFKLARRQICWWWVLEQHELRSLAAAAGDAREWRSLHKVAKDTRKVRGWLLAAQLAGLVIAAVLLRKYAPWWAWAAVAVAVWPWLAHYGKPADKRIISAAVVSPRFRLINADVVLRAYYAAGLGHAEKPDMQITFASTMQRDGDGSRVVVVHRDLTRPVIERQTS